MVSIAVTNPQWLRPADSVKVTARRFPVCCASGAVDVGY